ncbi:hypothetical protein COEREDRAFT_6225 [Coemansia reversa NRRL 1564]|uniref:Bromo domain-containing protein n=1 Tax=Coemansia reversa (strain ATCC 12441 / NRRL 1564) TaxID=763665 RepID=A0A2G5BJC2_COERN|nr:hypothetical protein COEREDRAFT_6225 [Coemansia reversa NRRL 1564]|eukprot:PIA19072.1 hypothetical protein COEREDRAFT_6225 [Coemansia reversa NRRL 1564]
MFDNARTYNEEGSMVYNDACALQRVLEEKLGELTGANYTTPMGTQSPLPATFSVALQSSGVASASAADSASTAPIGDAAIATASTSAALSNMVVPHANATPASELQGRRFSDDVQQLK